MSKKAKAPRPENVPPKGKKHNPYFQLPYSAIDVALDSKLTAGALRCLLFALKADRGNHKLLKLGIDRSSTGTHSGRNAVIKGLDQLVACGLLIEVNERGDYRLGPVFDKFVPDEDTMCNDVVGSTNEEQPVEPTPDSYADTMFATWNARVGDSQKEAELDDIGRERVGTWVETRLKIKGDPIADFKKALGHFIAHGHEVPREHNKARDPSQYHFNGFMKVIDMFLKAASSVKSKESTSEPATPTDVLRTTFQQVVPSTNSHDGAEPQKPSDIPSKYTSFIIRKDENGKFIYREGRITSAEELALIYEHAFDIAGIPVSMNSKSAKDKCIEDYLGILDGKSPSQVVRMVGFAKMLSKTEEQQEYFRGHPFGYHTGRTIFIEALQHVMQIDAQRAVAMADDKKEIDSGERRKEHIRSIRLYMDYIANDFNVFGDRVREHNIDGMNRTIEALVHDYGVPAPDTLPQDIIDGLRCLSTLGAYQIPDSLLGATGKGSWEPTFNWSSDKAVVELEEKWRKNQACGEIKVTSYESIP